MNSAVWSITLLGSVSFLLAHSLAIPPSHANSGHNHDGDTSIHHPHHIGDGHDHSVDLPSLNPVNPGARNSERNGRAQVGGGARGKRFLFDIFDGGYGGYGYHHDYHDYGHHHHHDYDHHHHHHY